MTRRILGGILVVALAVPVVTCKPAVRGNGRNLLLITLETTRADHLGTYGYERQTSPRIDRLASEGVVFDRFSSVSPRTNPSLASLMTSRYPHEHGVRNLLLTLESEQLTLAQTHPRLVAASGFDQGFDDYHDDVTAHPRAPQSVAAAVDWIREAAGGTRPWFLWLHLMDPHWTYDPPAGWRTEFGPDDPRPASLYAALRDRERTIGPVIFRNRMADDEIAAFIDLYDAEIRYTDDAIVELLRVIDELGLRDGTVIALTSDHGESLGEHDYFFEHGDLGTEPEIRVPMILVAPGIIPPGLRIASTAESLDVAPTLLDLLGLPNEDRFRGRSLIPLLEQRDNEDRTCFGETGKRFHEENDRREVDGNAGKRRWIRRGNFKLVHTPKAEGDPERQLFDLTSSAAETEDVSHQHPELFEELGTALDTWMAEDQGEDRDYHISPEAREELRALGYVN
jgi:arylsulfatase A-like enzyme